MLMTCGAELLHNQKSAKAQHRGKCGNRKGNTTTERRKEYRERKGKKRREGKKSERENEIVVIPALSFTL